MLVPMSAAMKWMKMLKMSFSMNYRPIKDLRLDQLRTASTMRYLSLFSVYFVPTRFEPVSSNHDLYCRVDCKKSLQKSKYSCRVVTPFLGWKLLLLLGRSNFTL